MNTEVFLRNTALLLTAWCFLFPSVASAGAKYRLKVAVQAPERSLWGRTLRDISREVKEETNGEVQLKVYAGGVHGDERTVLRKIRVGQLHGGVFMSDGVVTICPDSLALSLPFLFQDEDELTYALEGVSPELEQLARQKGYEILAWPRLGFSYLFSQEEIRTIDALRGSKPWLIENNPIGRHFFGALRVTPVSTGVPNVLPALQSGLIRTVFTPPLGLVAMQWHTRVKYRLNLRITFSIGLFALQKKALKRLPEAHQETLRAVFKRNNLNLTNKLRKENNAALEVLQKHGIETVTVDPETRQELERTTEEVGKRMARKEFSAAIFEKVKGRIREYREGAPRK